MNNFEWEQVYGRCIVCCKPHDPAMTRGGRQACKECWRLKRSFTTDMNLFVVCQPILWVEWGTV
jgi:hypothetical protein